MESGTDLDRELSPSPPDNSSDERERQREIERVVKLRGDLSAVRSAPPSPLLVRLADRLGVSLNELLQDMPSDNVRRTHYPVLAEQLPDGRTVYKQKY